MVLNSIKAVSFSKEIFFPLKVLDLSAISYLLQICIPPSRPGQEVSPSCPMVPPAWDWGTAQKGHGTSGSIMGLRWGMPYVDRQAFPGINITFSRTSYASGNNLTG